MGKEAQIGVYYIECTASTMEIDRDARIYCSKADVVVMRTLEALGKD